MIYLLITALVVSVCLNFYQKVVGDDLKVELDEWKEKYWDENRLAFTPKPEIKQAEPEEEENFVRRTNVTRATAETYKNVFDFDHNGQRILEDLTMRFCKSPYVRGGQEAERESCYRAGQNSVVQTILNQINKANDPNYNEEQDND
ncbi:hypothetical protein [Acinetobacter gyllenbergii]|uniref:Bbp19 family protein n=1 Tax=Acinetobacter gyllenbergii TaxID=134534 RepID=UPI003AF42B10